MEKCNYKEEILLHILPHVVDRVLAPRPSLVGVTPVIMLPYMAKETADVVEVPTHLRYGEYLGLSMRAQFNPMSP